jgi:serine/threonine-protein kinase
MVEANQNLKRIGRYELVDEIGRGGMAVVYRARDTVLSREVALKLLHPHLASHVEARKRFEREAQAVARLHHPGVVEIYDYSGEEDETQSDEVYIVMELVEGTTLRKFLDAHPESPLPAEAAALIARQVFAALDAAHAQNVIHRDVKPENILIGPGGTIKLSDFGIAHLAGVDQMTVTGQILGSPAYMSPEHIEKAELDPRADIFSVGTLLYEMTVGALPFHGNNPHQIIKRIVEGYYDHPMSVNPTIGHQIAKVTVRCMQRDPELRYETAGLATGDLDEALEAMGIGAPEEELLAYFEDPEAWATEKRPQVVTRTLALGQKARRARHLPEAMDHFNRVLALEPGNNKALDAVAGLSRRRRVRRVAERAGLIVAVVIALVAIGWLVMKNVVSTTDKNASTRRNDEPANHAVVEDAGAAGKTPQPTPAADAGTADDKDAGAAPKPKLMAKLMVPKPKQTRPVRFNPFPMRVDISIDDGPPFPFGIATRIRTLTVGTHKIAFTPTSTAANAYRADTWTVNVTPGKDPLPINRTLKLKPCRLKINCNVQAVVSVTGRVTKQTNKFFKVNLKDKPREEVEVLVTAEGYRPQAMKVTIAAGEAVERNVKLIKETKPATP